MGDDAAEHVLGQLGGEGTAGEPAVLAAQLQRMPMRQTVDLASKAAVGWINQRFPSQKPVSEDERELLVDAWTAYLETAMEAPTPFEAALFCSALIIGPRWWGERQDRRRKAEAMAAQDPARN